METYHSGGIWAFQGLINQGLIEKPYWIQRVMGYQTGTYPAVDNVISLLRELPERDALAMLWNRSFQSSHDNISGYFRRAYRVGLEEIIYYRLGLKLKSNAEAVERAVIIEHELNREVATPFQARKMLGLLDITTKYT